jgi:hypothetical protein
MKLRFTIRDLQGWYDWNVEAPATKRTVISAVIISLAAILVYVPQFVSLTLLFALPQWLLYALYFSPPPLFGAGIGNLVGRPFLGALVGVLIYVLFCITHALFVTHGRFMPVVGYTLN